MVHLAYNEYLSDIDRTTVHRASCIYRISRNNNIDDDDYDVDVESDDDCADDGDKW